MFRELPRHPAGDEISDDVPRPGVGQLVVDFGGAIGKEHEQLVEVNEPRRRREVQRLIEGHEIAVVETHAPPLDAAPPEVVGHAREVFAVRVPEMGQPVLQARGVRPGEAF